MPPTGEDLARRLAGLRRAARGLLGRGGGVRPSEEVVARPSAARGQGTVARARGGLAATAMALAARLPSRGADAPAPRRRMGGRPAPWRRGAGAVVGGSAAGLAEGFGRGRVDLPLAVSGGAHALLIGWVLLGGALARDRPPELPADMSVRVVSASELAALEAAFPAEPAPEPEPAAVEPPEPQPEEAPPPPEPASPPEPAPAPEPEPAPVPEPDPEPAPPPPAAAERVAPEPAPPPPPEVPTEEAARAAVAPDPDAEAPREEAREAAPEEAGAVLASEALPAEPAPPAAAPSQEAPPASPRPEPRPEPAPAAQPPAEPEPAVAEAPAAPRTPASSAEADSATLDAAIEGALAEALGGGVEPEAEPAAEPGPEPGPAAPAGPPLTGAEREGFRVAVQGCWAVDPGSDAARATVTVAFDLDRQGRVEGGAVRLLSAQGGTEAAQETAFQAARRAILRCQRDGYDLPPDKHEAWRAVEMTFNPEGMSIR